MIQFSLFMMMFCVIYEVLEIILNLFSLNLTVQISWSAQTHHLDTINCNLILWFTFLHCIVQYLYDIIATP